MSAMVPRRFKFTGQPELEALTVIEGADGAALMRADEVGIVLGYGSAGRTLVTQIADEWSDRIRADKDTVTVTGEDLAALKAAGFVKPNAPSLVLLTESGLYRVLMLSGKPAALRLQEWLADDVLPALRKTGTYGTPGGQIDRLLQDQASARARGSWGAVASMHAVEERLRRNEREAAAKASRVRRIETEETSGHKRQTPAPEAVARWLAGKDGVTLREVATVAGIGFGKADQMRACEWLRALGFERRRVRNAAPLWYRRLSLVVGGA